MTTLINLFGASSSGKSTLMADLYSEMKLRGFNAEMCMEFVKKMAWEERFPNDYDQFYILGKEVKQQSRLFGKVDYIISDSPVIQSSFYKYYLTGADNLTATAREFYKMARQDGVEIYNFFLKRNKPYEPNGRYQTEEEANQISDKLLEFLNFNDIVYHHLVCKDRDRVKEVFKILGLKW